MSFKRHASNENQSSDVSKAKKAKTLANEIHGACLAGNTEKLKSILIEDRLESAVIEEINKKKTLIELSQNGETEMLKELLKNGVSPNCKNEEGQTPLHIACYNLNADMVKALLNHGANVNTEDNKKESPFVSISICEPHDETVALAIAQNLLKHGADINSRTKEGQTLLRLAAEMGFLSIVLELLKLGADCNLIDFSHQTPLHGVVKYDDNENMQCARELLRHGADINAEDENGDTPLHIASKFGNISVVKELLSHNPIVDIENNEDCTPIFLASVEGHALIIKEFLNCHGELALYEDSLPMVAFWGHLEIVKMLLEHGADVNIRNMDNKGDTPLHYAALNGHLEVVKELLKYGADINAQSDDGQTAIHKLLHGTYIKPYPEQEMLKVMKILLDKTYHINLRIKCNEGRTPLETAIKLDRLVLARKIAEVLCSKPKITDSIYPLKHLL